MKVVPKAARMKTHPVQGSRMCKDCMRYEAEEIVSLGPQRGDSFLKTWIWKRSFQYSGLRAPLAQVVEQTFMPGKRGDSFLKTWIWKTVFHYSALRT